MYWALPVQREVSRALGVMATLEVGPPTDVKWQGKGSRLDWDRGPTEGLGTPVLMFKHHRWEGIILNLAFREFK